MKKNNKKKIITFGVLLGLIVTVLVISRYTLADTLENNVEVAPNSDLIYYISVKYDGVDIKGIKSNDATVSEVYSGNLLVEDKIPDGLTFNGFVLSDDEDGSIGSVERNNATKPCLGKVVDDTKEPTNEGVWNAEHTEYTYHGLHYNENNRTVTFSVKNLKAGCVLNVGIKTKTPATIDDPNTVEKEIRRDFYNFATIRENAVTIYSNTVHAFMGSETVTLYDIKYEYTGNVPESAPAPPATTSYPKGLIVSVANDIYAEGYTFNGWTSSDVSITDGKFEVPDKEVVIKGSFTKIDAYKVTYNIDGYIPDDYVIPTEKEYYPGVTINVDSLKAGDIFNGYRFLGWETTDAEISDDNDFIMANNNVVITGKFEEIKYSVTYKFQGSIKPENSDSLLPTTKSYRSGDTVTLESITEPSGYKFLGWYKEDSFTMPDEDVIIYGEWILQTGTFEPTITKEIVGSKPYYRVGDTIKYKITVKNTAPFPIKDVMVVESKDGTKFNGGTGYSSNGKVATISSIGANETIILYSEYTVTSEDSNKVINDAEIKGALADDNYQLKSQEYRATSSVNLQSKIKICVNLSGSDVGNSFQIKISNTSYETWINLKKNECMDVYVNPSTYNIKEIVPQEYQIKQITGDLTSNDSDLLVVQGNNYEINITNEFVKKGFYHSFGRIMNTVIGGS